jgi:hypothetical protein
MGCARCPIRSRGATRKGLGHKLLDGLAAATRNGALVHLCFYLILFQLRAQLAATRHKFSRGRVEMVVAEIINIIHYLVFIFVVLTPFFGNDYLMSMHLLVIPFILLHWATNQSVCALTEMEKLITGKTCDEETFFGKIVGPIYKFKTKREENLFVWTTMITLWFITFMRLQKTDFAYLRADIAAIRAMIRI